MNAAALFVSRFKRQTGGPGMFAHIAGRIGPAPQPTLSSGLTDPDPLWPAMEHAMREALSGWHAAGELPALEVVISQVLIHPVDSNARSFVLALQAALWRLAGREVHRCQVLIAPLDMDLPHGLQSLLDAGHVEQASELLAALDAPDPRLHRRLLLEVALTHDTGHLIAALFCRDPARAEAALAEVVAAERASLCHDLQAPAESTWQRQRQERSLARLDGPLGCDRASAAETLRLLREVGGDARRGFGYDWRLKQAIIAALR
jgi:hypothetical protein